MSRTPQVLGQIDKILASIEGNQKSAAANTEAGSIGGETSHPVKNVDDNTSKATEGFRSKENESDVREAVGSPGVNSASDATTGGQESVQLNIGVTAGETGKDVPSAKGGKDDGGTYDGKSTHPARTDNDQLEGGKYASVKDAISVLRHRTKTAQALGNELMSQLAVQGSKQAAAPATQASQAAAPAPTTAKVAATEEAQAGYNYAGVLKDETDKQALYQANVVALAETVGIGEAQAEKVAEYLDELYAKQAEDGDKDGDSGESSGGDDAGSSAPPDAASGGPPPGADAGAGGPPMGGGAGDPAAALQGIDPQVLQQLLQLLLAQGGGAGGAGGAPGGDPSAMLQGGQSMGGDAAMGGMAAPPDAGAGGGLPPDAGAGGLPPGGPPPGGDDQMGMLHQAMLMAGVNPDVVEAKAAAKSASALKAFMAKHGGKAPSWRPKNAAEAKQVEGMANYFRELVGTNR